MRALTARRLPMMEFASCKGPPGQPTALYVMHPAKEQQWLRTARCMFSLRHGKTRNGCAVHACAQSTVPSTTSTMSMTHCHAACSLFHAS